MTVAKNRLLAVALIGLINNGATFRPAATTRVSLSQWWYNSQQNCSLRRVYDKTYWRSSTNGRTTRNQSCSLKQVSDGHDWWLLYWQLAATGISNLYIRINNLNESMVVGKRFQNQVDWQTKHEFWVRLDGCENVRGWMQISSPTTTDVYCDGQYPWEVE